MKILLDENLDEGLGGFFPNCETRHVKAMGWQGLKNGALFAKAEQEGFQAFVTADKNMPYQQNVKNRPFSLVILDIHPNVLVNQAACAAQVESALETAKAGEAIVIEGPHPKRR